MLTAECQYCGQVILFDPDLRHWVTAQSRWCRTDDNPVQVHTPLLKRKLEP